MQYTNKTKIGKYAKNNNMDFRLIQGGKNHQYALDQSTLCSLLHNEKHWNSRRDQQWEGSHNFFIAISLANSLL